LALFALCFCVVIACSFFFFSSKLSRDINSKWEVFGCATLAFSERYGAVQTEEACRIRNNDELDKSVRAEDVVKYVRAQRIKW
jgi:hypothetical protein